MDTCLE